MSTFPKDHYKHMLETPVEQLVREIVDRKIADWPMEIIDRLAEEELSRRFNEHVS